MKDILKLPDNSQLDTKEIVTDKDIQKKADDFDRLMLLIKDKLNDNLLKTRKKAQILTMAPDWTRARIAKYLDVSEYMVHEARKLAREKGFWHFLNLNVTSACEKKLKIRSSCFMKMMNIRSWYQEQKIMLVLQGIFINKTFVTL